MNATSKNSKVLVIDQNKERAQVTQAALENMHYKSVVVTNLEDIPNPGSAKSNYLAVMLGKVSAAPQLESLLKLGRPGASRVPFLMMPDSSDDPALVDQLDPQRAWSMHSPVERPELVSLLERAKKCDRRKKSCKRFTPTGRSSQISRVRELIEQVAPHNSTVLITGESGTGKEVVARSIHENSSRADMPFVPINCGAIPAELLESELFGHEKGSFTGALSSRKGRFEMAEGGTLFLDEIGDMPMEAQTRLLRVLQEGTFTTVGGSRSIKADVRIIAATHRDLDRLIQQGLFREDLYFRLNVVPLRLPPLRERTEDIPDLVRHFLTVCESEGLPARFLDNEALERLKAHRWPGNVRELENLVRRLSAIQADERITQEAVTQALTSDSFRTDDASGGAANSTLGEFTESYLAEYFSQFNGEIPPPGLYDKVIKEVEEPLLNAALSSVNGNQLKASELLGINRNTLRKKMREHDIRAIRVPGIAVQES